MRATITVTQVGDQNWVSSVTPIKIGDFIALDDDPTTWYQLTGTITGITNTQYGNFYLQDETGSVYVYGIESSKGAGDRYFLTDMGINVGDQITIIAYKGSYNDTMEAMGAYYVSHEARPLLSLESSTLNLENISSTFDVTIPYAGATIGIDLSSTDSSWLTLNSQSTVTEEGTTKAVFNFSVPVNMGDDRTTTVGFYSVSADGAIRNDVTLTINQTGGFKQVYKQVSTVTSGKTYLIVANDAIAAVTPAQTANYDYLGVAEVTVFNGEITFYGPTSEFVITSTEGGYTIMDTYGRYLYQSGTYNNFNVSTNPSSGQVWTITAQGDGTFEIKNVAVQKYVQYDSNYKSYGSYSDSRGVMPKLFERVD